MRRAAQLLLYGYLLMGRSFAYWGIPQLRLFVGEAVLAGFLVARSRTLVGRFGAALVTPSPLSGLVWALFVFMGYGVFTLIWGIGQGYPTLVALQSFAFNYYPLFLFLGLAVGLEHPDFLPDFVRSIAWCNAIYGAAHVLVLHRFDVPNPLAPEVGLIGGPGATGPAMLGLLCFERSFKRVWPLFAVNAFVMLGKQVRAEWLGLAVALALVWVLAGQARRIGAGTFAVVALVAGMYLTSLDLPSPEGRGGRFSARELVARALAPIDKQAAAQVSEHAGFYAGTFSWRTRWWQGIWRSVHEDPKWMAFGHGYGFPLVDVVPYLRGHRETRTPHSIFYSALGYGGWLGVAALYAFQLLLARLLWSVYWETGQPFGLALWAFTFTGAHFGNVLEAPFNAIPFYLLAGLAAVPALTARRQTAFAYEDPAGPQLLPAAWGRG